jgi:hypothetical protein
MSYPVFYVPAGDVLPVPFTSYAASTGASATLTGLAVTDIEIYKDGSVTQRASDAGYTLLDTDGIDFDGITGIHGFSIDTGDNTDASFYTVGAWYKVVVSAVTIDSQTVNFIACVFRLMPAETVAGVPQVDQRYVAGVQLGAYLATGTVSGYSSATSVTLATGQNIRKGSIIVATANTGIGGAAVVNSYTSGTGVTVLESPGFPAALDNTTTYIAFAGPNLTAIPMDASGYPEVNTKYVNDVEVTGDGGSGTEWGPA